MATVAELLVEAGWQSDVNSSRWLVGEANGKVYADLYVYSRRARSPLGEPTHLVDVFPEYDSWSVTKLDKWGGTGSRAPMRSGSIAELPVLATWLEVNVGPEPAEQLRHAIDCAAAATTTS